MDCNGVCDDYPIFILWVLISLENVVYMSVVVCFVAFFANDIYGYLSWREMGKRQGVDLGV